MIWKCVLFKGEYPVSYVWVSTAAWGLFCSMKILHLQSWLEIGLIRFSLGTVGGLVVYLSFLPLISIDSILSPFGRTNTFWLVLWGRFPIRLYSNSLISFYLCMKMVRELFSVSFGDFSFLNYGHFAFFNSSNWKILFETFSFGYEVYSGWVGLKFQIIIEGIICFMPHINLSLFS